MTSTTLTAVGVGYMNADDATSAFSARTGYVPTGHFSTPQTQRAWLLFDITSIPSDATVTAAALRMTINFNFLGPSHTINAYRLKRRCYSGGGTAPERWPLYQGSHTNYRQDQTTAWATAGAGNTTTDRDATAIGSKAVTSASSGEQTFTLTASLVQDWVDGTMVNNGMLLIADNESGDTLIRWDTLDSGNAPKLDVTYTPVAHDLDESLEGYWTLGDTYADGTGNGHTMTAVNAPTSVAGKLGTATRFASASSQYLSNSDAALKVDNSDWTVAGWVKLTDKTNFYGVFGQRDIAAPTGGGGWHVFYHKVDVLDYFVAQLEDDGGTAEVADTIGYAGGNPSAGTWVFLAVRNDSVRKWFHLFVNGNAPNADGPHAGIYNGWGPYVDTAIAASNPFRIGDNHNSEYMNGDIDEVGFWKRALSNAEILTLYNGGSGLSPLTGGEPSGTSMSLIGVG